MKRHGFVALVCAQLLFSGCGGSSGTQPAAQCSPAPLGAQSFNPKYSRFLVQTAGAEQLLKTLQPSGEAVNKYRVVKFTADVKRCHTA